MTYELIEREVRLANPVADLTVLESMPATVLNLPRRMEVQIDQRVEINSPPNGTKRAALFAIVALAVVGIGLALLLQAEPDAPVVGAPATEPTSDATATTVQAIAPTTSPPEAAVETELEGIWYIDMGNRGVSRLVIRGNTTRGPTYSERAVGSRSREI